MKFVLKYTILFNILIASNSNCILRTSLVEDAKLNFTELGAKYGQPSVEQHEVITEDGYILTIFHIRGPRKIPVFLLHGMADSADSFILRGRTSLVVSLANAGYDVWAGNVRGNKYSRRHRKLNPDIDREFWDFSFHEIGCYDVPAMIDYILQTTGEKKLQFIGHSQGTTQPFVLLSKRPEYNEKVALLIAMAPISYLVDLREPVRTLAQLAPIFNEMTQFTGVDDIIPVNSILFSFLRLVCSQDFLSYEICFLWTTFYFTGFDAKRIEPEFAKAIIGHYPDHLSRKQAIHTNQLQLSKRFCEFDYGLAENLRRYGYLLPPEYNLRVVTTKVALVLGENDQLATIRDSELLRSVLPNVVSYHVLKDNWNHIDFTMANDMNVTLFPLLFQLLDIYN